MSSALNPVVVSRALNLPLKADSLDARPVDVTLVQKAGRWEYVPEGGQDLRGSCIQSITIRELSAEKAVVCLMLGTAEHPEVYKWLSQMCDAGYTHVSVCQYYAHVLRNSGLLTEAKGAGAVGYLRDMKIITGQRLTPDFVLNKGQTVVKSECERITQYFPIGNEMTPEEKSVCLRTLETLNTLADGEPMSFNPHGSTLITAGTGREISIRIIMQYHIMGMEMQRASVPDMSPESYSRMVVYIHNKMAGVE